MKLNNIKLYIQYIISLSWRRKSRYQWVETKPEFGMGSYDWLVTPGITFNEYITRTNNANKK